MSQKRTKIRSQVVTKQRIMLLGSGELGKEFAIAAKRLGLSVIAVDRYAGAPAMQVADGFEVIEMLDGDSLAAVVYKHQPTIIVPEIEAIRTEKLQEFEATGIRVVPSARAAHLTMNRDAIRDLAAHQLGLRTARFAYAKSLEELETASGQIGFPNVVKPVMSSSGKGQSVVKKKSDVEKAWQFAVAGMRGDKQKVIVEEFIKFDYEITLLTVKQLEGPTLFVEAIGHRQERGDYQESWMPIAISNSLKAQAQQMAKRITDYLGGAGLFGVEFFVKGKEIFFSELSPRPHDTGMVTMISQSLSEFELHLRAILGLPIPKIEYFGASASAVVLAAKESEDFEILGLEKALARPGIEVRLFGKPSTRPYRRMGVALARDKNVTAARKTARAAAKQIKFIYR